MDLNRAYQILELSPSASEDEVKKQFKKLASKYHPDKNHEVDASEKFKEVKEAYELITNPPPIQQQMFNINIEDLFARAVGFTKKMKPTIKISTMLSFAEAVLGCNKSFRIEKFIKCGRCSGRGAEISTEACSVCNGLGRRVQRQGNVTMFSSCDACHSLGRKSSTCGDCGGKGAVKAERDLEVQMQGGLHTGQSVQLKGAGHYSPQPFNDGFIGDVIIDVSVTPETNMKILGQDVISVLDVTLLEALEGVIKTVTTVKGPAMVNIPSGSRNKDEISLSGYGVPMNGSHKFILDVTYPEQITSLIDSLKQLKN